jgi:hypothetical protein
MRRVRTGRDAEVECVHQTTIRGVVDANLAGLTKSRRIGERQDQMGIGIHMNCMIRGGTRNGGGGARKREQGNGGKRADVDRRVRSQKKCSLKPLILEQDTIPAADL